MGALQSCHVTKSVPCVPITMASVTKAIASTVLLLLLATLPYVKVSFKGDLQKVLNGLLYQEGRYLVGNGRRVAVGFGSCWDLVTDGVKLLDASRISPPVTPEHYDVVSNSDDLAKIFAYFFESGAAAERFSNDSDFFNSLISTATDSLNESHWTIGGNAPVISQRLAVEGWEVLLAAIMRPKTAKSIHPSIKLSIDTSTNHIKEDVHLIMEYGYKSVWGKYKSPRANRFILHNDYSNMMLESLNGFAGAIMDFKPDLVIIGGLQMMDNFYYNPKIRTERLKELGNLLESLPSSTKIHFEMASFTDEGFLKELLEYVIPHADSMGMNEQELANLYSLLKADSIKLVADFNPRVAASLDEGREILSMLETKKRDLSSYRRLTRLHIHTLAYQAIFTLKDSGWVHTRTATAKASLVANRHVCSSHEVNLESAKLIMDESFSVSTQPGSTRVLLTEEEPVSCWYEGPMKICVAPNIVCTAVYKTAGAGDNISAAGLSVQL